MIFLFGKLKVLNNLTNDIIGFIFLVDQLGQPKAKEI